VIVAPQPEEAMDVIEDNRRSVITPKSSPKGSIGTLTQNVTG
jgi:hypothetical protein